MVLRSTKYNDVYFSADNGLAETQYVFLDGNNVSSAWQKQTQFIIAETGFGTGLNFLATWKLFEETAPAGHRLHFISFEKYPLSKGEIREALSVWNDELGHYINRYLQLYPLRVPGPHTIHLTSQVTLTIWIGDVEDILPQWQNFKVDAWFLDGFTPAKNPEMWTDFLFNHMARLSHSQTTLASFTAAGHVRRGLAAAGFEVTKAKGFGRKRDMIMGRFTGEVKKPLKQPQPSVAIVGSGLAGCALAYIAQVYGIKATIYEAKNTLAAAASGGKTGMINPKLTAKPTPQSDYYTSAYANALRVMQQLQEMYDIDFQQCGSLHLCTDEDKDRRFKGYCDNLGWHNDHIKREEHHLFYPDAACVSPVKLCHAMAEHADIRMNARIENIGLLKEDYIILANGYAVNDFLDTTLPVHSVRGQVSWIKPQGGLKRNICFGGYMTPQNEEGFHVLGASFQPWETNIDVTKEDHIDNLDRYNTATNNALSYNDVVGGWAALRSSSKDRFPIVGHLNQNIYCSVAHGSHGIISSLMAAEIIMAQIMGGPAPASESVLRALSPERFL